MGDLCSWDPPQVGQKELGGGSRRAGHPSSPELRGPVSRGQCPVGEALCLCPLDSCACDSREGPVLRGSCFPPPWVCLGEVMDSWGLSVLLFATLRLSLLGRGLRPSISQALMPALDGGAVPYIFQWGNREGREWICHQGRPAGQRWGQDRDPGLAIPKVHLLFFL